MISFFPKVRPILFLGCFKIWKISSLFTFTLLVWIHPQRRVCLTTRTQRGFQLYLVCYILHSLKLSDTRLPSATRKESTSRITVMSPINYSRNRVKSLKSVIQMPGRMICSQSFRRSDFNNLHPASHETQMRFCRTQHDRQTAGEEIQSRHHLDKDCIDDSKSSKSRRNLKKMIQSAQKSYAPVNDFRFRRERNSGRYRYQSKKMENT